MVKKWELLSTESVFKSPYVEVNRDKLRKADGGIVDDFYSMKRKNWVEVVALTSDKKLPLVSQYRNGIKEVIWTLPAGFIDEGQTPLQAAQRELLEETGFSAGSFIELGEFVVSPGAFSERAFVFLAQDAEKIQEQKLDKDEEIEVGLFDFEKLLSEVKKRKSFLIDSASVNGILLASEVLTN
jgi:8-oxo-dGTP pyrophosphatase MutT (NUDIX family)